MPTCIVSCICGKASITFSSSQLRSRLLCCCVDCRQAAAHAASIGGPIVPRGPQDLIYFPNAVTDVKGSELLMLQKLRPDGRSTRVVAQCCHSILAVDHPNYQGNVVMVPLSTCKVQHPMPMLPPQRLIYTGDWPESYGPVPAFESPPLGEPYATEANSTPVSGRDMVEDSKRLQESTAWSGKTLVILGLIEGQRFD
jgi:hypothetical protein